MRKGGSYNGNDLPLLGDPAPKKADLAKIASIRLLDHIVLGHSSFVFIREKGRRRPLPLISAPSPIFNPRNPATIRNTSCVSACR